MKRRINNFFRKNIITTAISLISTLLIINVALIFHNKSTIIHNNEAKKEAEAIRFLAEQLVSYSLHNMDMGIRAYGLTKSKELLKPCSTAISKIDPAFNELGARLQKQSYDVSGLRALRKTYIEYGNFLNEMVRMVDIDSMNTFRKMLEEDRGLKVFTHWADAGIKVQDYEDKLISDAEEKYKSAIDNNIYLQIFMLIVGLPTLGFIVYKLKNDNKERQRLLSELEENNRKYVFNPGTEANLHPKELIEHSIKNLQQASRFIEHISEGQYDTEWPELNQTNKNLNESNLAGRLTRMRDQLKQLKNDEERRLWTNEGLTKFSEAVRNHQKNLVELSNEVIKFLTKYMNAQQGGLFVLKEDETESYLELTACYAFERKKFIERKIKIGVGLVGQAYLEGETTLLTNLPQGYTYITSGMGGATPGCVVIIPMRYNEKIEAVIELAALGNFENYQIAFVEKAGEFVASALQSVRTTEKMQSLLEASQKQAEEMRSTEEEMRQNLEELLTTQEEMVRRQKEIDLIKEEEMTKAHKLAESNRQATHELLEKLMVAEEELKKLKTVVV
ncbi:MAG TPA: GAF domain-containing protein [Cyclobacteriaceae bacterium]|nr:GAF domain-containing protein [Cyclobacteriaceae bacterium]